MEIIYNQVFLLHDTGFHPENKKRLEACGNLQKRDIPNGEQYLELVHDKKHIENVKTACNRSVSLDVDTLTSPGSYEAAIHAVGAAVLASETNGFALVRPPGHHAYANHGSGFCLFNNIAIACQKLVTEGKRVAIIDFDGHYGDGTADIFYSTDKVLYCSLHQYPAFPGNGSVHETGEAAGKGFTVNVPMPPGSADDLLIHSLNSIFIPVIAQFKPDMLAISAGFDAYQFDPLLNLNVSMNGFYEIGKLLGSKFKNAFALLEGGYNTDALPKCIFNFLNGMNGKEILYEETATVSEATVKQEYERRLEQVKANLKEHWELL